MQQIIVHSRIIARLKSLFWKKNNIEKYNTSDIQQTEELELLIIIIKTHRYLHELFQYTKMMKSLDYISLHTISETLPRIQQKELCSRQA